MARMKKAQVRIVLRHSFGRRSAEIETSNDAGRTWTLSSSHAIVTCHTAGDWDAVSLDLISILSLECLTFDRQFIGIKNDLAKEEDA